MSQYYMFTISPHSICADLNKTIDYNKNRQYYQVYKQQDRDDKDLRIRIPDVNGSIIQYTNIMKKQQNQSKNLRFHKELDL